MKKIVYLRKINLIIGYMNKSELVDAMASASGLTKTDSKKALDAFISVVSNTLKKGDLLVLSASNLYKNHFPSSLQCMFPHYADKH